jgi:hypothetical protein
LHFSAPPRLGAKTSLFFIRDHPRHPRFNLVFRIPHGIVLVLSKRFAWFLGRGAISVAGEAEQTSPGTSETRSRGAGQNRRGRRQGLRSVRRTWRSTESIVRPRPSWLHTGQPYDSSYSREYPADCECVAHGYKRRWGGDRPWRWERTNGLAFTPLAGAGP